MTSRRRQPLVVVPVRWILCIASAVVALTAASAAASPAKPAPPPCRDAQLRAALVNPDAGAGQRYVELRLTNVSTVRCSLSAYPGVQLIDADGQRIPTRVVPSTSGSFRRVVLPAGHGASSVWHWAGIPLSDEAQTGPCEPPPSRVDVTPPGASTPLSIRWSFDPVCGHGELEVIRPLRTR